MVLPKSIIWTECWSVVELTPSSIQQDQIWKVALFHGLFVTAEEDLVHHGVVISAFHRLDLEVAIPFRSALATARKETAASC